VFINPGSNRPRSAGNRSVVAYVDCSVRAGESDAIADTVNLRTVSPPLQRNAHVPGLWGQGLASPV